MKQYSRVTYAVRCQISALLETKTSIPVIASILGYHKTTIYRELKRNKGCRKYIPERANRFAQKRFKLCKRIPFIRGSIKKRITQKLSRGWSPEIIQGRLNHELGISISHETIYRFLRTNPEHATKLKYYKRRGYGRYRQLMSRPDWMNSIKERPKIVDTRKRFGDWERDTMYTKNRGFLLVCLERKSRLIKIAKLNTHKSEEVSIKTQELISSTKRRVYTVTNDNGGEFRWKNPIGYDCYYCEPHKPQQRGSVENVIGLLRQYIKRDTDLETVDLKKIEREINNRPRKVLNFKTPYEVFNNKKVALAM